jgi:hypothetical protein
MVNILGKCYQNCSHTVGGNPIPEAFPLDVTSYKREPLWYHKRGLLQTSTGFGRKLVTEHMIQIENRWYRIYCCQLSNSGTHYIIKKGKHIVIDLDDVCI